VTQFTSNDPLSIEVHIARELAESNRQSREYLDSKFEELHEFLVSGFPNNSPELHRKWHEDAAASAEIRKKLIVTVITTVVGSTMATLLGSFLIKLIANQ